MWEESFFSISTINDDGALFYNETTGKFLTIRNIGNIIQFEIDHGFRNYQPHFHYDVVIIDVTALT